MSQNVGHSWVDSWVRRPTVTIDDSAVAQPHTLTVVPAGGGGTTNTYSGTIYQEVGRPRVSRPLPSVSAEKKRLLFRIILPCICLLMAMVGVLISGIVLCGSSSCLWKSGPAVIAPEDRPDAIVAYINSITLTNRTLTYRTLTPTRVLVTTATNQTIYNTTYSNATGANVTNVTTSSNATDFRGTMNATAPPDDVQNATVPPDSVANATAPPDDGTLAPEDTVNATAPPDNATPAPVAPSPEELALQWLIDTDPSQLIPNTAARKFRLGQRYALWTLGVQRVNVESDPDTAWSQHRGWATATANECDWYGVTCDKRPVDGVGVQNVVIRLELENYDVTVELPTDLALLTHLESLQLKFSSLYGTLPSTMGLWTNLTSLNLPGNALTGTLPTSIGNWSHLETLQLSGASYSSFSGTLPTVMGQWTDLTSLDISNHASLAGTLPTEIGQWTNIIAFQVTMCGLLGSLPMTMQEWKYLLSFDVRGNSFDGSLPSFMGAWTNLLDVSLGANAFSGTLPDWIGQWTALTEFEAADTLFSGSLPTTMSRWTQIYSMHLGDNVLTGSMPEAVCTAPQLYEAEVDCPEVFCDCCCCFPCSLSVGLPKRPWCVEPSQ